MINIDKLKRFFEFVCNKWQAGTPGTSEFNLLAERASWEMFAKEIGAKYQYQPGRPIPTTHYQATRQITENLRPFMTPELTKPLTTDGKWTIPTDYQYLAFFGFLAPEVRECETEVNPVPVTIINDDQLYNTLRGYRAPSWTYPHAVEYADYWQFYPKNLGYIQVKYLKKPVSPEWVGVVPSGSYLPVYDPSASTDLEWNEDMFNAITMKMASYMGINLTEQQLIQYAEQVPVS